MSLTTYPARGTPARRRGPVASALLATLALGLGACVDEGPIAPGGQGGPDSPAPSLPTTDDGLAYDAQVLQGLDPLISGADHDAEGLTLDGVRNLEAMTIDHFAPSAELVISIQPGLLYDWDIHAVGGDTVYLATIEPVPAPMSVTNSDEISLADGEIPAEDAAAITNWRVSVAEAAEIALPYAPGEILGIMPSNVPSSIVFVVVRQDDGSLVRVAVDNVTGEPINVVTVVEGGSGSGPEQDTDEPTA